MLLRTDFDHAKSRKHLFGECASFWKKVVLTKRIKWFDGSDGQPSFNHAWYIWAAHSGKPTLAYGIAMIAIAMILIRGISGMVTPRCGM